MMKVVLGWLLLIAFPLSAGASNADAFPPETNYDTTVYPDEALVNLRIRNNRWPDCHSLETAIRDIFRIEGVDETADATEEKAFALWKWVLTLMSNSGSRIFEGNPVGKWVKAVGDKNTQQVRSAGAISCCTSTACTSAGA